MFNKKFLIKDHKYAYVRKMIKLKFIKILFLNVLKVNKKMI